MHTTYSPLSSVRSDRRLLSAFPLPFIVLAVLSVLVVCHDASAAFAAPAASPLFGGVFAPTRLDAMSAVPIVTPMASSGATSPKGAIIPADVGLLVCDPVGSGSPSDTLVGFGVGCGHWLHLIAAGQPDFGRTALWESRARIMQELGRRDLRLAPADIAPLFKMAGITHVACGTISGTPENCTLSYMLYSLPGRLPVGAPLTQTGTLPQIEAALPVMAQEIDMRLGLNHIPMTPPPALSVDELTRLGIDADNPASRPTELLFLAQMSARSALAGVLLLHTRAIEDRLLLNTAVKTLLAQQPRNTLVLSAIGDKATSASEPYAAQTSSLFHQYPKSALLASAVLWEQRSWGNWKDKRAAAERVTVDSPNNPASWLTLGQSLSNIAQDLRQGRIAADITPHEWSILTRLYEEWEGAEREATYIDPKHAHAWMELAVAATFASDDKPARDAFWKAQALDQDKAEVYSWGLQMFQPKWGDDAADLDKVAALAAAQEYDDTYGAIEVSENLNDAGIATESPKYSAMGSQVIAQIIATDRGKVAQSPDDAYAHWDLAYALFNERTVSSVREATLQYRAAEQLLPNAPELHVWLASALFQQSDIAGEVAELRQVIALEPANIDAHLQLGDALIYQQNFPEAQSQFQSVLQLDPSNANAHFGLGQLFKAENNPLAAADEFAEAVHLKPDYPVAWIHLCYTLYLSKRYDASLAAAGKALNVISQSHQPDNAIEESIHDTMADDYLNKNDCTNSLKECHESLHINPADPVAQETMAEAYWGEGKQSQARAQWEHVIALGNSVVLDTARKLLASHPAP